MTAVNEYLPTEQAMPYLLNDLISEWIQIIWNIVKFLYEHTKNMFDN